MVPFRQILIAIDGSNTADKALDEAIRLARFTGARLHLLHVVDELAYVNGFEPAMNYLNEILPLMREAGERILASGIAKALAAGVQVEATNVVEGPGRLHEHVNAQAALVDADLIVVGSHGRHGVGRALLGSDAEQVIRHAAVPVLVVKAAELMQTRQ
ncbi:MAG: universal stress protein [Pseudomonadota bacterium]